MGLPLAAYVYLFHYKKLYDVLGKYQIYLILSLVMLEPSCCMISSYGVAITGVVYDIIHGPPFLNCNHQGCSLFMSQQNQQSIAEGLITGCFCRCSMGVSCSDWMRLQCNSVDGEYEE